MPPRVAVRLRVVDTRPDETLSPFPAEAKQKNLWTRCVSLYQFVRATRKHPENFAQMLLGLPSNAERQHSRSLTNRRRLGHCLEELCFMRVYGLP